MLFVPDISQWNMLLVLGYVSILWFSPLKMLGNEKLLPNLHWDYLMQYRRAKTPGATYFFTVVTFRRRKILCDPENRELLRTAFRNTKIRHPFTIDAFVLLPEHLHCIWTLPPGDMDYSMRWNAIKGYLSRHCLDKYKTPPSRAQKHKRAQTVWQPRFWEHQIRDERDYEKHCDYIHWNRVKHGLVKCASDWQYSSIHHYIKLNILDRNWGDGDMTFPDEIGYE